jgi:hypothetical protein
VHSNFEKNIYTRYEKDVKECETCLKNAPAPARSLISGLRAENFGDMIFVDHCEVTLNKDKYLVFIILDGATNLLWARPQRTAEASDTLDGLRDWMDTHQCVPKHLVADVGFNSPEFIKFSTGSSTCQLGQGHLGQIEQKQEFDFSRSSST